MPFIFVGLTLLALVVISGMIWLTFGLVALGLHLLMAGFIGALADAVVPGTIPWGWVGAVLAGLVGSWLGVLILGHVGPALFGIPIIPSFVGAVILAFALSLVAKRRTA